MSFCCCVVPWKSLLATQDRVASAIDSLPSVKSIDQVAISPDGSQVAYIVAGELFVAAASDGASHRIAPDQNTIREVTWSADSRHLAWLCDVPGEKPASHCGLRLLMALTLCDVQVSTAMRKRLAIRQMQRGLRCSTSRVCRVPLALCSR